MSGSEGGVFMEQGQTVRMITTKNYDYLDRLTFVGNTPGSSVGSGPQLPAFTYTYNAANQRVRVNLADGSFWLYEYDSLGQVISGKRYWGDWTPVAGQQFEYRFDDIGNRIESRSGGDQFGQNLRQASYYANLLNQYTSRDVPRYADIMGAALATATVTVTSPNALNNGQAVYRRGEYFRKELAYSSGTGHSALWEQVTVSASGGESKSGYVFVSKTPEVFSYDLDGNLTSDGRWNYYWDGENRLVKVESRSDTPQVSWRRVEWTYDALGRRVRQTTSHWTNNAWQVKEDVKFVSDPMLFGRHIAELNATDNSLVRTYVWGIDLSGSMDGAGGVGGLLWVNQHTGTSAGAHFCAYDGNGNVVALVSANTGTETARYEYAPFGEPIRVTGPMSKENPFRFSTKRTCNTTDLVLYEYRAYSPNLGRWVSRDPVQEEGGVNLYTAFLNAAVGNLDPDGMKPVPSQRGGSGTAARIGACVAQCGLEYIIGEWIGKIAAHSYTYTCGEIKRWCEGRPDEEGTEKLPKLEDVISGDVGIGEEVWMKFIGCFIDCMGGPEFGVRAELGPGIVRCNHKERSVDYGYSVLLTVTLDGVKVATYSVDVLRSCKGMYAFPYQTCCCD